MVVKSTIFNFKNKLEKQRFLQNFVWKLTKTNDNNILFEKILEYLNNRLQTSVKFQESIYKILLSILGIAIIILLIYGLFQFFPEIILNTKLCFCGSMVKFSFES